MPSTSDLSEHLISCKTRYLSDMASGKGSNWTVVMGNEAGDLDTVASSIAYAWIRSVQEATIALIPTKRSDLTLRPENIHALQRAGLQSDLDELLCIDDFSWDRTFPSHRFALVDHNSLHPQYASQNENASVVAIIDHHEDEQKHKDTANPRIVAPSGSCSSHVAQLCPAEMPSGLATLLLCAILIDTGGLKAGGKALQVDRDAAASLLPRSGLLSSLSTSQNVPCTEEQANIAELKALTAELIDKKTSVSHLSTRDLLRRDYKEYSLTLSGSSPEMQIAAGIATVPMGFSEWIPRDKRSFFTLTQAWMEERRLAVFGILTTFRDKEHSGKHGAGKHRREMLWVIRDDNQANASERYDSHHLASTLWRGFEEDGELRLERIDFRLFSVENPEGLFGKAFHCRIYKQKNTDATRKKAAPLLRHLVEDPIS